MLSPKWRDPHLAMKEHLQLSIGNMIGFSLFIAGITRQVLGSSLKAPDHQMLQRKSQSLSKTSRTGHQSDIFRQGFFKANIPHLLRCDLSLRSEARFLRSFCPS